MNAAERNPMAPVDPEMRALLLGSIPALRAFAFSLTRDFDRSDDLVQDTLVRAWTKADSFTPGTNLYAWLFTILRNLFYSEQRKRRREVEDADGVMAGRLTALPDQEARCGALGVPGGPEHPAGEPARGAGAGGGPELHLRGGRRDLRRRGRDHQEPGQPGAGSG